MKKVGFIGMPEPGTEKILRGLVPMLISLKFMLIKRVVIKKIIFMIVTGFGLIGHKASVTANK
jgi:hypothetical protein